MCGSQRTTFWFSPSTCTCVSGANTLPGLCSKFLYLLSHLLLAQEVSFKLIFLLKYSTIIGGKKEI